MAHRLYFSTPLELVRETWQRIGPMGDDWLSPPGSWDEVISRSAQKVVREVHLPARHLRVVITSEAVSEDAIRSTSEVYLRGLMAARGHEIETIGKDGRRSFWDRRVEVVPVGIAANWAWLHVSRWMYETELAETKHREHLMDCSLTQIDDGSGQSSLARVSI